MREYGRIHVSFWTSDTIRALGDDGRTLAAYLLTCEHNTIIGAFRLPAAYACDDLGWTVERFKKGFKTLEEHGFAAYCRATKWVCILKFLEWNPAENPNQQKAIDKALAALPETSFSEGLRKGSVTLAKQGAGAGEGTEAGAGGASGPPPCPHQEIVALYHELLPTNPKIKVWSGEREDHLRTRWREDEKRQSLDYWRRFFVHVSKSEFLTGRVAGQGKRPFFAGLDWLVLPSNFAKVIEGKYHDRG